MKNIKNFIVGLFTILAATCVVYGLGKGVSLLNGESLDCLQTFVTGVRTIAFGAVFVLVAILFVACVLWATELGKSVSKKFKGKRA